MYSVWKLIRFSLRIVSISLYPLECIVHFGRRVVCKWDHVSPRRRFSLSRLFCVWCHIFENKLEWMLKRFHLEVFTANCPVGLLDLQLSILMNECHLWTFLLYLPQMWMLLWCDLHSRPVTLACGSFCCPSAHFVFPWHTLASNTTHSWGTL